MLKEGLLFAFSILALQNQDSEGIRYLPETGWLGNDPSARFYEYWFGRHLLAMNEPPLSAPTQLGGLRQRFRLLVLPNSEPAFAYRIDESLDGSAVLRWVQLSGAGGYAPGTIAEESRRYLRPREIHRLKSSIREAEFGSLPRQWSREGIVTNADGTQTLTICFHGTTLVLEILDQDGHQIMTRSCWIEEPIRRLLRVVYRLKPPPRAEGIE